MVDFARQRLESGHLPLGSWFPYLQLGAAQFQHYQSLPYVIGGALASIFGTATIVQWTLYLGLATWPISVYLGMRLLDQEPAPAAGAALLAPLVVSVPPAGFEIWSYVWGGNGLWPQLFAMWLLPPTLGLAWRAIRRGHGYLPAVVLLGLTCATHALVGYVAMVGVAVFALVEWHTLLVSLRRATLVALGALGAIAWFVIPLVVDARSATTSSAYNSADQHDSYGVRRVLGWLVTGRLFDDGRLRLITALLIVGVVVCAARWKRDVRGRALLGFFGVNLVLFCGRPTFGPLLDLLPFVRDLQLERFLAGVQLGGVFLAGVGGAWCVAQVVRGVRSLTARELRVAATTTGVAALVGVVLAVFAGWWQLGHLASDSAAGIHAQRTADAAEGPDIDHLLAMAEARGPGRVYAGMRHGNGDSYRVGNAPLYLGLLDQGHDGIGLTLRTVSLMADVEPSFDDRDLAQYQLLGIRYLLLPRQASPPEFATPLASAGRFRLYEVPTGGYLSLVDTVAPALTADRTTMTEAPAHSFARPRHTKGEAAGWRSMARRPPHRRSQTRRPAAPRVGCRAST